MQTMEVNLVFWILFLYEGSQCGTGKVLRLKDLNMHNEVLTAAFFFAHLYEKKKGNEQ